MFVARSYLAALVLCLGLAAGVSAAARAELILDDFDDPAGVVSPEMLNDFVDTPNVGAFQATRSIRIFGLGATPEGRIDVGLAGSSSFQASLGELNADSVPLPKFVSVQSQYRFELSDATQGGQNNAVLYDFQRLTWAVVPAYLRIIVHDTTDSYEAVVRNVPLSETPFTLAMPFADFRVRGGGPSGADFTRIESAFVTLGVIQGIGPENLELEMDLERIRFGRIPEPGTNCLIWLGIGVLLVAYRFDGSSNFRRNDHGSEADETCRMRRSCFLSRSSDTVLGGDGGGHARWRSHAATAR